MSQVIPLVRMRNQLDDASKCISELVDLMWLYGEGNDVLGYYLSFMQLVLPEIREAIRQVIINAGYEIRDSYYPEDEVFQDQDFFAGVRILTKQEVMVTLVQLLLLPFKNLSAVNSDHLISSCHRALCGLLGVDLDSDRFGSPVTLTLAQFIQQKLSNLSELKKQFLLVLLSPDIGREELGWVAIHVI